jgi:tetratricopeptide (TPR) repeat protein
MMADSYSLWRGKVVNVRWLLSSVSMVCFICAVAATTPARNIEREVEATKALQAAERLQAEGKIQEALSTYEEILKKYPDTNLENDILVKIARCYSRLGDDDSAIRIYLKLISDSPDSIEASQAVSLMVNLYAQRYRFDEVIAMSRNLAQQFPGTEAAAMALYRIAGYLYSQGEFQEAIREYENFINQFPESIMRSTAFNRLTSLYIREGMFEKAERRLMDRLAQDPKDTYMLRQLALVYQKQGEYDRALNLYQRILATTPNDADIYEHMGELYAERGDEQRAIAEWSKITESAPGQYSRHQMLAHILKSHGFYDQAAAEYRKAIELNPQFFLYKQLADVHVVKKRFDSAIDVYLDALIRFPVNHPDRSRITKDMLELCDLEGLYGKVISRLKTHLIRSPDSIPTLLTLADVHFHQGDFEDSLQQFRNIASLYPDKGKILVDHAQTLERERQFEHAIRFYQTALDLFPGSDISSHALMHIGQLKSRLHQPQAAIANLQRVLDLEMADRESEIENLLLPAYILIGDIYLQQMHDVHAALSTYTEAKRRISILDTGYSTPDNPASSIPDIDLRIAECYRLMGRYDTAENILSSIQTANGSSRTRRSGSIVARIAKSRGDCYFSRGDFDSALTQYQEAIRGLMNEDWVNDCLDRIALIKDYSDHDLQSLLEVHAQVERLRKSGQYNEALALCVSAATPVSRSPDPRFNRGQRARPPDIRRSSPTDRIQLEIGDLLALQMKATEAISAYEELVQSNSPLAPEAQLRIADIYWRQMSDPKQAIEGYSALIENYPDSVLVAEARKKIRQLASEKSLENNLP